MPKGSLELNESTKPGSNSSSDGRHPDLPMSGTPRTGSFLNVLAERAVVAQRVTCERRAEEETGDYWWLLVQTAGSGARVARASRRLRLRPGRGGRPRPPRRGASRSNGQSRVRGRRVEDADA